MTCHRAQYKVNRIFVIEIPEVPEFVQIVKQAIRGKNNGWMNLEVLKNIFP
jgi:hypothetical protein